MFSIATISVHRFIDNVGAYVGFGSIIAVALLVLLYFAHARETATLRDRLDEAHARIGGLEQRIAQLMAPQRGRGPVPPPVTPQGSPVSVPGVITPPARPGASIIPSVRRIPSAATQAGAAAAVAPPPPLVAVLGALAPAAPVGMAGPALASATTMIPRASSIGDDAAPAATQETMLVAPVTNGAGGNGAVTDVVTEGEGGGGAEAGTAGGNGVVTDAVTGVVTGGGGGAGAKGPAKAKAPATAAAAAASKPTASPRGTGAAPAPAASAPRASAPGASAPLAPSGPPRVQIGGDGPSAPPRRTVPSSRPPLLDDFGPAGGDRRRLSGRLLPLVIGGAAVIAIIVGLIVIINTGGTTTGTVNHGSGNATGANVVNHKKHKAAPFVASDFKISVLNGTPVAGLAADVGKVLVAQGFKQGNVTNAAAQTDTSTFVYYVTGTSTASNRTAAQHVASTLKLPGSRVRAAGPSVLQSCATSASGASLGGCRANVIVSVGQDRANLATSPSN